MNIVRVEDTLLTGMARTGPECGLSPLKWIEDDSAVYV